MSHVGSASCLADSGGPWTPWIRPWFATHQRSHNYYALRIQPSESPWQFKRHVRSTKQIFKIGGEKWGGSGRSCRPCSDGLGMYMIYYASNSFITAKTYTSHLWGLFFGLLPMAKLSEPVSGRQKHRQSTKPESGKKANFFVLDKKLRARIMYPFLHY